MADDHPNIGRRFYKAYRDMPDAGLRRKKGLKVSAILRDVLQGKDIQYILDVGCSSGVLLDVVVAGLKPKLALGIDMDARVLPKPTQQRIAVVGDAMVLPVASDSIDVILCNHTYKYTPNALKLFGEIKRVLKPGGIVYFSAVNARWPIESHYHLPFIHWLPKNLAGLVLRVLGHSSGYFEKPLGTSQLRDLVSDFELYDYTLKVIAHPERYSAEDVVHPRLAPYFLPIARLLYGFLPGYLWVLVKRPEVSQSKAVER